MVYRHRERVELLPDGLASNSQGSSIAQQSPLPSTGLISNHSRDSCGSHSKTWEFRSSAEVRDIAAVVDVTDDRMMDATGASRHPEKRFEEEGSAQENRSTDIRPT